MIHCTTAVIDRTRRNARLCAKTVAVEPCDRLAQGVGGFGLQHDAAVVRTGKRQVFRKIEFARTERKVVLPAERVVAVDMVQPLGVLQNDRFIRAADTVVVSDVKGQPEHGALQQEVERFHLEIRKAVAVFHTNLKVRIADMAVSASSRKSRMLFRY